MVIVDESVLTDPRRLDAVERVRRTLAAAPMPVDDLARLAARLLGAPMAQVTLVGGGDEHVAGAHALPGRLNARGALPLDYSVGRYVVSAGAAVRCACLPAGNLLTTRYGIRTFVGVPLHDRGGCAVGALAVLDTASGTGPTTRSGPCARSQRCCRSGPPTRPPRRRRACWTRPAATPASSPRCWRASRSAWWPATRTARWWC